MVGFELSNIFSWIKLSSKSFFAIFVFSGGFLFMPKNAWHYLGLSFFVSGSYYSWIGLIFILSGSFVFANIIFWFLPIFSSIKDKLTINIKRNSILKNLTKDEKSVLVTYIGNETKSQMISVTDGIYKSLKKADIIYQATDSYDIDEEGYIFNIQDWAWKKLNKNLDLLNPELEEYKNNMND